MVLCGGTMASWKLTDCTGDDNNVVVVEAGIGYGVAIVERLGVAMILWWSSGLEWQWYCAIVVMEETIGVAFVS